MTAKLPSSSSPLHVEVPRSDRREALHLVHVVCCDATGATLGHFGDPGYETYLRSAAKPIQLLTALTLRPALLDECSLEEIASMGASHSGERRHVEAVRGLLDRHGLDESLFQCGAHFSYYHQATWDYGRDDIPITAINNNCSGKHTAMLLACQTQGWPYKSYLEAEHPMQRANTARLARYLGEDPGELVYGVDGCSVPTWWLPVEKTAVAFARFGSPDWAETDFERRAVSRIFDAFHQCAWYTAGTTRFGTPFNAESDGAWLGKIGGEGIYCVSFRDKGTAIVLKVQDGNSRAIPPALLHAMREWELIDEDQLRRLSDWIEVERKNPAGRSLGPIHVVEKG